VYWNRLYEPEAIARDRKIKQSLREDGLLAESFNASLLYEPWEIGKSDGEPYKVFTPYWKAVQRHGVFQPILPVPAELPPLPCQLESTPIGDLGLLPNIQWDGGLRQNWHPGEEVALQGLEGFIGKSREPKSCWPGSGAEPAFRSWTPECGSCGTPAGCTTGFAWWPGRFWSKICASIGWKVRGGFGKP